MKTSTEEFLDLYRIMQVDHQAEPEVIEAAYRKLSKKYHPDTNKNSGAETKMKQINQAYAVLSVPEQRRQYDLQYRQWMAEREKPNVKAPVSPERQLAERAGEILKSYFSNLASGWFEAAYTLVSEQDKKFISQADFLEWQKTVTGLYEIGDFHCAHFKTTTGKECGNKAFDSVLEFQVSLAERERSSGKVNHNEFSRLVVLEKNQLKMYLGYTDIRKIIAKFKKLADQIVEPEEYGYEKPGLYKELEKETARAKRYFRPFTLALLETINPPPSEDDPGNELYETTFGRAIREVRHHLRKTDCCGRWGRNRIMIILPETRSFSAGKAVEKILGVLKAGETKQESQLSLEFCAGIVQYNQTSIQELVDLLISNVIAAKNKGEWRIVF